MRYKGRTAGRYASAKAFAARAFISPTAFEQARGQALWERVEAGSGSRWGRPLLSRPRGAVDSGLAAVLAAVESVAVSVRVCVDFGFGWMVVRFVRVIRLPACARVSRVSRVCLSRLPPVSFYRCRRCGFVPLHVLVVTKSIRCPAQKSIQKRC